MVPKEFAGRSSCYCVPCAWNSDARRPADGSRVQPVDLSKKQAPLRGLVRCCAFRVLVRLRRSAPSTLGRCGPRVVRSRSTSIRIGGRGCIWSAIRRCRAGILRIRSSRSRTSRGRRRCFSRWSCWFSRWSCGLRRGRRGARSRRSRGCRSGGRCRSSSRRGCCSSRRSGGSCGRSRSPPLGCSGTRTGTLPCGPTGGCATSRALRHHPRGAAQNHEC